MKIVKSRFDELRRVKNPVRNDATYVRYFRGCNLIKDFVSSDDRGYAYLDDPDTVGKFHAVTIFITNEDFESPEEIKMLCEIMECFDSMTISYGNDKVIITLLVNNIYTEKDK